MEILLLAAVGAIAFALFAAGYVIGHAAGRIYGRSEGFDEAVAKERRYLKALRDL